MNLCFACKQIRLVPTNRQKVGNDLALDAKRHLCKVTGNRAGQPEAAYNRDSGSGTASWHPTRSRRERWWRA